MYGSLTQASHLARDARRKADVENIRGALESYRSNNGGYPDALATLASTTPQYIKAVPTDPQTDAAYTYAPVTCTVVNTLNLCATYSISAGLETVHNGQYNADPLGSVVTTPAKPTAVPIPTVPPLIPPTSAVATPMP